MKDFFESLNKINIFKTSETVERIFNRIIVERIFNCQAFNQKKQKSFCKVLKKTRFCDRLAYIGRIILNIKKIKTKGRQDEFIYHAPRHDRLE